MAASAFIRTAGMGRLFNALSSLVEAAEAERDWWVGTIVVYSAHLEFGTQHMTARPYFQPAIQRLGKRLDFAQRKTVGQRQRGRSQWALMVDPDAEARRLPGQSPLSARIALLLEREIKDVIREKGLIDTGHLRASITAAPSLPRMKREAFNRMSTSETSRRTGREVNRSDIVDRSR